MITDWLSVAIAAGALLLSGYALLVARHARSEATVAVANRKTRRAAIAAALDSGNQLLEGLRQERSRGESGEGHDEEITRWEDEPHRAVEIADPALLPRYHSPLRHMTPIHTLEERCRVLLEIQDRL
jgi:hypothetical protein